MNASLYALNGAILILAGLVPGRAGDRVLATDKDSDETLIARAGKGDRLAASTLVVRHADRIYAVCRRMLRNQTAAEDAAQETFLRLWKHAAKWKPQGAQFGTWLVRVAMNICFDRLRREGREISDEGIPERADPAPRADEVMAARDRRDAVEGALALLPDRQRAAIILCHYQELSNIDAAAALDVSVDALESLLARGRRALKDSLIARRDELLEDGGHDRNVVIS